MTRALPEPPHLIVVGVDVLGSEVVSVVLGHGDDPVTLLAAHGWRVQRARDVMSDTGGKQMLTMSFVVEPRAVAPRQLGDRLQRDEELVTIEGEVPQPYQRVAAYAYVTSSRGVLMTQFSDQTNAVGKWGLPGGGLQTSEAPDRAVVREAWEESGQVIEVGALAHIQTTRWIGRAPTGRLEDFHAVRLVYRAACHAPTEPVVHDVGGTTASAAWVPPSDLDRLDVASSWRWLTSEVVMAPDEADGAEHDQQETDAHECPRPQL